jgi:hypothetical protein
LTLVPDHFAYDDDAPGGAAPAFSAAATLTLAAAQASGCVVVNALDLDFTSIVVQPEGGAPAVLCASADACAVAAKPFARAEAANSSAYQDLVALDLGGVVLAAGSTALLTFNYTGGVGATPSALGLHRSSPFSACEGGAACVARVLVATQLERTGARRVLPSHDAPARKAVFDVTVRVPAAAAPVVLSNAPQRSRAAAEGDAATDVVVFEPSPLMSPYLLAVVAGELEQTNSSAAAAAAAYDVRAWAVPGRAAGMATALSFARKALPYYEAYFDAPQPLTQFDLVAVPGKAGAMENWGLLLLDEPRALHDPAAAGVYSRLQAAAVVCHEAAHQWVGNLITAPDWTQLFLQEGAASALEYGCMGAVAPEFDPGAISFRMVSPAGEKPAYHDGPLTSALTLAGDPLTPPMVPPSEAALEAPRAMFATYAKGAAYFLMLQTFLDDTMTPTRSPNGPGFFRDVWREVVARRANATFVVRDFYAAAYAQMDAALRASVGPGKELESLPSAELFMARVVPVLAAATPAEARAAGSNGTATILSWLYTRTYPRMRAEPPGMVDAANATQTTLNIGLNQTRFCQWNLTQAEAEGAGIEDASERLRVRRACLPDLGRAGWGVARHGARLQLGRPPSPPLWLPPVPAPSAQLPGSAAGARAPAEFPRRAPSTLTPAARRPRAPPQCPPSARHATTPCASPPPCSSATSPTAPRARRAPMWQSRREGVLPRSGGWATPTGRACGAPPTAARSWTTCWPSWRPPSPAAAPPPPRCARRPARRSKGSSPAAAAARCSAPSAECGRPAAGLRSLGVASRGCLPRPAPT